MVSVPEWLLRMGEKYLRAEEIREEKDLQFPILFNKRAPLCVSTWKKIMVE
jgi:hypothetical protein